MSDFLQHYTLSYTPLSPIHIGTGDSYEPTNYVIDNGTLYEYDTGGAMAALTASNRNELNKIVNTRANEDMLKAVQRFFLRATRSAQALGHQCHSRVGWCCPALR